MGLSKYTQAPCQASKQSLHVALVPLLNASQGCVHLLSVYASGWWNARDVWLSRGACLPPQRPLSPPFWFELHLNHYPGGERGYTGPCHAIPLTVYYKTNDIIEPILHLLRSR